MTGWSKQAYAAELKRFRANGDVWIGADEIPADVAVPAAWRELLAAPDSALADRLMRMWAGVIDRLPAVARFFRDTLMRPAVFQRESGDVVLLYPFTVERDDLNFFVGHAPLGDRAPADKPSWRKLPDDLQRFYLTIHDGWTFFPSNAMGPLPSGDQSALTSKLDLTLKELRKLGVDPDLVRPVFHNGGGDYLCLDLRESAGDGSSAGRIWWHENPATLEAVDFWAAMNAWFGTFVAEADSR
ncbi:SMI1/KNR4 family protein [Burkholderia stagnalis]